jgi:hypothetical protein
MENYIFNQEVVWRKLETKKQSYMTYATNIYYSYMRRYQIRSEGSIIRRNYLNVLITHPYFNAYRFYHSTFAYISRNIDLKFLIPRVLNEALLELYQDLKTRKPFHCQCYAVIPNEITMEVEEDDTVEEQTNNSVIEISSDEENVNEEMPIVILSDDSSDEEELSSSPTF